ncbi:MAG: DUF4878 domain-containing protein [Bacteroidales bacterium]|nr:DUF4878 domain-containing protein [Bacteroidales bacterium]
MKRGRFMALTGAALLAASAMFVFSCRSQGEKLGPEGVVTEFVSAMKSGDFDKAYSLCDSSSMHSHLDAYAQMWQKMSQKDSASFSAMTEILAGTEVHFKGVTEGDGTCVVEYALEMEGSGKNCSATLRLEEGEWKLVEITDRH